MTGVEEERPGAEVHAVAQHRAENLRGNRLRPGQPVRVAEHDADEIDLVQPCLDLLGRGRLAVVPEPELADERGKPDAALVAVQGPWPGNHDHFSLGWL